MSGNLSLNRGPGAAVEVGLSGQKGTQQKRSLGRGWASSWTWVSNAPLWQRRPTASQAGVAKVVRGSDPSASTSGVLCCAGVPERKRNGHTGVSPGEATKMVRGAPDLWGEPERAGSVQLGNRKLKGDLVAVTNSLMQGWTIHVGPFLCCTATAQEATDPSGNKGNASQIVEGEKPQNLQKHWKRCTEKFGICIFGDIQNLTGHGPQQPASPVCGFRGAGLDDLERSSLNGSNGPAFGQKFANLNVSSNKYIQLLALVYLGYI